MWTVCDPVRAEKTIKNRRENNGFARLSDNGRITRYSTGRNSLVSYSFVNNDHGKKQIHVNELLRSNIRCPTLIDIKLKQILAMEKGQIQSKNYFNIFRGYLRIGLILMQTNKIFQ